jgi:sentrin-specific protease 1
MFSVPKQLGESVSEVQHLEDESQVWSKLEDQFNRCHEESSNSKALEALKRRLALLQKQFDDAQRNDNRANGLFTRQRVLQISPSSSSTIAAHVDVERGREARPGHDREVKPGDGREAKAGNSQPWYELYGNAHKRDFTLKRLDLELELVSTKFEALKFTSKELFKNKEKEAEVEKKSLIQQALEDAFALLNDDEEADVSLALKGWNRREVLVMHENSNIEITREILQCLLPGGWLNDEVINLYLELLKEREKREPDKFLKCHFFNTFFYKKLYNPNTKYEYKAVRRWTTPRKIGYSLIDCDKIFVPIHKEIHWCLAIIDMKEKKFQYLDSLGGDDAHVLDVLARYITDEAKDKTGKDLDVSSWEMELVEDLPQQENGSDCGMFMIKYADFHSRGLPLSFFQTHMPYFRKRTAKEILRLKAE